MQGCIAGIGMHARFQSLSGFFKSPLGGVEHTQVVVCLDDARIRLDQLAESFDGLVGLTLLGLNHAFQETQFSVMRKPVLFLLDQFCSLLELAGSEGLTNALGGRAGHSSTARHAKDRSPHQAVSARKLRKNKSG